MSLRHRRVFIKHTIFATLFTGMAPFELFAAKNSTETINDTSTKDRDLTFLFQGDSITDGNRGRTDWDLNHIMGHGYAFTIASRVGADFPEKNLKFINKGISGNKVTDLAGRWKADALELKPDVLSILVGINDSSSYLADPTKGVSPEQYEQVYRQILDQSKAQNPDLLLVIGEPFTLPYAGAEGAANPRLADVKKRQEIAKRLALDYNAVFVPFQQVFNDALKRAPEKYWIWDHIHPTVAGHELMAREWLKQCSSRLKFLKKEF